MTEDASKAVDKPKEKPMTITERKLLKELIDNDFNVLRREIDVYAEELKRNAIDRVAEQFGDADQRCQAALTEWMELKRTIGLQLSQFVDQKRAAGLTVQVRYQLAEFRDPTFSIMARESALTSVKNDVDREVNRAKTELERQRVAMHREILLSGLVSSQAKDLLDKQPNPRDILADALQNNPRIQVLTQARTQAIEGTVDTQAEEGVVQIPEVIDR